MKNFSLFPTLLTELNNKGKNALISSVFKFCFLVLKLWLMMREMVRLQAFSRGKKKKCQVNNQIEQKQGAIIMYKIINSPLNN